MAQLLLGDNWWIACQLSASVTLKERKGLFQGISGFHKQNSSHDKKQTEIS